MSSLWETFSKIYNDQNDSVDEGNKCHPIGYADGDGDTDADDDGDDDQRNNDGSRFLLAVIIIGIS